MMNRPSIDLATNQLIHQLKAIIDDDFQFIDLTVIDDNYKSTNEVTIVNGEIMVVVKK